MGVEIQEHYTFIGESENVKTFYNFLKPFDIDNILSSYEIISGIISFNKSSKKSSKSAEPQTSANGKTLITNNEFNKMMFDLSDELEKAIENRYPIDKSAVTGTHLGWAMGLSELKELDGYACFRSGLDNRKSISAYIFKELLEKHFSGVYMYFQYSGDSNMFNTYCTNDKDMRFYAHPEQGKYYLHSGWNDIHVLYDGYYTKEEIADSYRLFLGNPDINPDFLPPFCGDEALHDDQYPIDDIQVVHCGKQEPPVELCRKLSLNKSSKNPIEEMAKFHGLTPDYQNAAQRTIDYIKYPELKDCPHIIGTRADGTPYLYRTVVYADEVRIPACIGGFDKNAFDWDVLFDSAYSLDESYDTDKYVLILTDAQKNKVNLKQAAGFFRIIKNDSGEILYEYKSEHSDNCNVDASDWSEDIPF